MARSQFTFTFRNAEPGAQVTFSAAVYASKTAQVAEGPTLVLDSTQTIAVWTDATELTATWVDGTGTSIAAEASLAIPVVVQTGGTLGTGPDQADAASIAAKAQKLTRTTVKTGNYTAAAGDMVPCDTTSAAFTVTLPNAPAVGSRVVVKIVTLGAGHFVTIACAGSDVFNKTAGGTTASLQLLGHAMNLQYDTGGIWTVVADDVPLSQLNGSYAAVPVAGTPAIAAVQATKAARFSFGGINGTNSSNTDIVFRLPITLPATTTRWRLNYRNADPQNGTAQTGVIHMTATYVGSPTFDAVGAVTGNFTAAPTLAVPAFDTPSDGSQITSDWVTAPALQFAAGVPTLVSFGLTATAGQVFNKASGGAKFRNNTGSAAQAGNQTVTLTGTFGVLGDMWIDYEYTGESSTALVGLMVGDSLTDGLNGSGPAFNVASQVGRRCRRPIVAAGRSGITAQTVAGFATNHYFWSKWGLGSGWVPDFALVWLGTNDIAVSARTDVNVETDLSTIYATLRGFGINRLYVATILPRALTTTPESYRISVNTWLKGLPSGAGQCFDFAAPVTDPAAVTQLLATYDSGDHIHLTQSGYTEVAQAVAGIA